MKILVDEDSQAHKQIELLRSDGHDVLTINELGKNGIPDLEVFALVQSLGRVLLTHNALDFHIIHEQHADHLGVMAVFRDADPRKNMSYLDIGRAINRLELSGAPIAGKFHVLNHWR